MAKQVVPGFFDGLDELTKEGLEARVRLGLERLANNSLMPESKRAKEDLKILTEAIDKYWLDQEHGYFHSNKVASRIEYLLEYCPNLNRDLRLCNLTPVEVNCVLAWACIFHDLGYFFGYNFVDHQSFGGLLFRYCFIVEVCDDDLLEYMETSISCHDYFCPLVNRTAMPDVFMENSMAEIFRLADKTTGTPAQEIERYYLTGKTYGRRYFNPDIPLARRFDLNCELSDIDQITAFLYHFAITPTDFFYVETAWLYASWQDSNTKRNKGKRGSYLAIKRLTLDVEHLGIDTWKEIEVIYRKFFDNYRIPHPLDK